MTYEIITALIAFALATSITPGPNNLMILASGANFGWRKSIPHWVGISSGFMLLTILSGLGIKSILDQYPSLKIMMQIASAIFLLWIAYKIATSSGPGATRQKSKPMTFLQAAAFQWINPKAWAMALTTISLYAPQNSVSGILIAAGIFGLINLPTIGLWLFAGQNLRNFLKDPVKLRWFNWIMAALLVATLFPILSNN